MKKVSELNTLCDVKACVIINNSYDLQLEVWPSPLRAQRMIANFKRMFEMKWSKTIVNQESFLS